MNTEACSASGRKSADQEVQRRRVVGREGRRRGGDIQDEGERRSERAGMMSHHRSEQWQYEGSIE